MTMRAQTMEVPRILDLSRTVARGSGRAPTGIDRAELAYLGCFCEQPGPIFGLVRTRAGFLLLGRDGVDRLRNAVAGLRYPHQN